MYLRLNILIAIGAFGGPGYSPSSCGSEAKALTPSNPRGVLKKRTAHWQNERPYPGEEKTVGAESNPTGNPIGGGKGYIDLIKKGTFAVKTFEQLRSALDKAKGGEVIFLPEGVEINLGGKPALMLPAGVTLASTRGQDGCKGARVYSTNMDTPALFTSGGPYGRITGLRLEGPHKKRSRAPLHSRGIIIEHFGFEVDNCEIWGFSHTGIQVRKGAIRTFVHHNSIHHNIRDGLGYGVSISSGTALIEANLFDHGRHYIAATGKPGEGYEARYNICGPVSTSHQFDMHGGRDRGDGTDIAGDWMNIHHNTFLNNRTAVKIRGVPCQTARVHRNRFVHNSLKNNVITGGRTRTHDNALGAPPKPKKGQPKK